MCRSETFHALGDDLVDVVDQLLHGCSFAWPAEGVHHQFWTFPGYFASILHRCAPRGPAARTAGGLTMTLVSDDSPTGSATLSGDDTPETDTCSPRSGRCRRTGSGPRPRPRHDVAVDRGGEHPVVPLRADSWAEQRSEERRVGEVGRARRGRGEQVKRCERGMGEE